MSLVTGIPEHKFRSRPRGRWVRLQARHLRGGGHLPRAGASSWAGPSSGPLRAAKTTSGDHPWARPYPGHRDRRDVRRKDARPARRPAHPHGPYPALLTPAIRCSGATCIPPSTSSRRTRSTARACSRTRRPPTRTGGRPARATFAIERAVDDLAAQLASTDRAPRRNWIGHDEFPYTTVCGLEYDSGNYEAATERALELLGYDGAPSRAGEPAGVGDPVQLGIGVSRTPRCAAGALPLAGREGYVAGGWERATVRMTPLGKAEVVGGTLRTARVTSRRSARSRPTPWAIRSITSRSSSTTPPPSRGARHVRLALAGRRQHRHPPRRRGPWWTRPSCWPRICSRPTPATIEFYAGTFRVKGTPSATKTIQELGLSRPSLSPPSPRTARHPPRRRPDRPETFSSPTARTFAP